VSLHTGSLAVRVERRSACRRVVVFAADFFCGAAGL
jgi:hypothetical protein